MLAANPIKAFIPTVKRVASKSFYENTLGLKLISVDDYGLEFDAHGTLLRVIFVESLTPHPFTVLGWNVPDIASVIHSLNAKKVFCEKYDFLKQDNLGVWLSPGGSKVAWFKDPDGNLLSLTE